MKQTRDSFQSNNRSIDLGLTKLIRCKIDRFQTNYYKHRSYFSFNEISVISTVQRRGFQPEDRICFHLCVASERRCDYLKCWNLRAWTMFLIRCDCDLIETLAFCVYCTRMKKDSDDAIQNSANTSSNRLWLHSKAFVHQITFFPISSHSRWSSD